jgi:hypothetical protein
MRIYAQIAKYIKLWIDIFGFIGVVSQSLEWRK